MSFATQAAPQARAHALGQGAISTFSMSMPYWAHSLMTCADASDQPLSLALLARAACQLQHTWGSALIAAVFVCTPHSISAAAQPTQQRQQRARTFWSSGTMDTVTPSTCTRRLACLSPLSLVQAWSRSESRLH